MLDLLEQKPARHKSKARSGHLPFANKPFLSAPSSADAELVEPTILLDPEEQHTIELSSLLKDPSYLSTLVH